MPYANNMDRLRDIGTEVKRQMALSNLPFSPDRSSDIIPGYLKDEFKNVVLTPDEETGMWYLTKDGAPIVVGNKKVGIVYDDPELFNKVKPKDIAELALNNLVSNSSINKYEDYKKYVQKNQKLSEKIYGAMLGVDASSPKINLYLMSEEEFTKSINSDFITLSSSSVKVLIISSFLKNNMYAIVTLHTYYILPYWKSQHLLEHFDYIYRIHSSNSCLIPHPLGVVLYIIHSSRSGVVFYKGGMATNELGNCLVSITSVLEILHCFNIIFCNLHNFPP